MIALLLLAMIPVVMWLGQTAMLARHGLPIRWRIDHGDAPKDVRLVGRILTQVSLGAAIVVFPLLIGLGPIEYYAAMFPRDGSSWQVWHGASASVVCLALLFIAWIVGGRLEIRVHQARRRWMRRLILLVPTAVFGAVVEELVFRAMVLKDLLETEWLPRGGAVAVGALVFALAHYVRAAKRRWTFPGHVALGFVLCVAFVQTGSLWLPIGLHAGGILIIMGLRPFAVFRGPAWLTGESVYPYAGVVGIAGLAILSAFVATYYGV